MQVFVSCDVCDDEVDPLVVVVEHWLEVSNDIGRYVPLILLAELEEAGQGYDAEPLKVDRSGELDVASTASPVVDGCSVVYDSVGHGRTLSVIPVPERVGEVPVPSPLSILEARNKLYSLLARLVKRLVEDGLSVGVVDVGDEFGLQVRDVELSSHICALVGSEKPALRRKTVPVRRDSSLHVVLVESNCSAIIPLLTSVPLPSLGASLVSCP